MNKEEAKNILKQTGYIGNEVGVAFEVAIKSIDKLDKIEEIIDDCDSGIISYGQLFLRIKDVLKQE